MLRVGVFILALTNFSYKALGDDYKVILQEDTRPGFIKNANSFSKDVLDIKIGLSKIEFDNLIFDIYGEKPRSSQIKISINKENVKFYSDYFYNISEFERFSKNQGTDSIGVLYSSPSGGNRIVSISRNLEFPNISTSPNCGSALQDIEAKYGKYTSNFQYANKYNIYIWIYDDLGKFIENSQIDPEKLFVVMQNIYSKYPHYIREAAKQRPLNEADQFIEIPKERNAANWTRIIPDHYFLFQNKINSALVVSISCHDKDKSRLESLNFNLDNFRYYISSAITAQENLDEQVKKRLEIPMNSNGLPKF